MRMRCVWFAVVVLAFAAPSRAQWVVVDPGAIAQAVLIAQRTMQQYQLAMEMARSLQNIDQFRMNPVGQLLLIPRVAAAVAPTLPRAAGAPLANLLDNDRRLGATLAQVESLNNFSQALSGRVRRLEQDVTAPGPHSMTAVLDVIAVAGLLAQQQAAMQAAIAQSQLDLMIAQELRAHEDQAGMVRIRAEQLAAPPLASGADVLQQWRQP